MNGELGSLFAHVAKARRLEGHREGAGDAEREEERADVHLERDAEDGEDLTETALRSAPPHLR